MNSAHFIGRCPRKGCKCVARVDIPLKESIRWSHGIIGVPGSSTSYTVHVPAWEPYQLFIHCVEHHRELRWERVNGTYNPDHKCDARCLNAVGPNCECSCGGHNHGANHSIGV